MLLRCTERYLTIVRPGRFQRGKDYQRRSDGRQQYHFQALRMLLRNQPEHSELKAENQLQNCQQTQAITAAISYDGNLTREAIASFRQAWEQSRYQDVVAEKNRLQTVLDLQGQQAATANMVQAAVAPVQAAVGQVVQQVQNIASHQLPTYPQPYIPGYAYGAYGTGTGFWG